MADQLPPAGWHPAPDGSSRYRYWDGQAWTDQYSPFAGTDLDPPPADGHQVAAGAPAQAAEGTHRAASEPAKLVRVCRKCSTQSENSGDFCPNCGKSYTRKSLSKRTKIITGVATAVVVFGGGGTATVVAVVNHNHHVKAAKAAAAQEAAAQEAQDASDEQERADREATVKEMEETITKDAQKEVSKGLLTGPIKYTSCDPLGGGSTDDLTAITTTFTCIAVNKENDDGTVSGYSYSATMNWTEGTYSWQLGSS